MPDQTPKKRKPWAELPIRVPRRKPVQAKRVRLRPYGLMEVIALERRLNEALGV